jgi:hypothetical protein
MKKVLWLIVCLMTMVVFTNCSKDDDDILDSKSIVGEWYDYQEQQDFQFAIGNLYIYKDGKSYNYYSSGAYMFDADISYQLTSSQLILTYKIKRDFSKEINEIQNEINSILATWYTNIEIQVAQTVQRNQLTEEQALALRQQALSQYETTLSTLQNNLDCLKELCQPHYVYYDIISSSYNELKLRCNDKVFTLHRFSK